MLDLCMATLKRPSQESDPPWIVVELQLLSHGALCIC